MLAIELKRLCKDGAVLFIVLAAIVSGIAFSDQDAYLAPALEIFLLLYASFTGWSLFERERQENAMEYVLALPLSRGRLLLLKFLPRLLCVALVLLVYLRLHQSWHLPSFLPPFDFSVLYAGIFLVSGAFSISFKNFISAFFTASLLSVGQVLLIKLLDSERGIGQAILQASLTALVFPIMFVILFRRFDIKPASYFNKKFFPGLLLLAGLIVAFIFYRAPDNWADYTLTSRGLILKNSCQRSEITLEHGRYRFDDCLMMLRESADGSTMVAVASKKPPAGVCSEKSIVAIDLKTGALRTIYRLAPGWSVSSGHRGEIGVIRAGTYSVFLQNIKLKKAMLLRVRDEKAGEIPIAGNFYDSEIQYVWYPDRTPAPLVNFKRPALVPAGRLRPGAGIGADRCAERLAGQDAPLRILRHESVPGRRRNYPAAAMETREIQKKPAPHRRFRVAQRTLSPVNKKFYCLDMENQLESELQLKEAPYTYQQSGDVFHVVLADGSTFTMMEFGAGVPRQTTWEAGFQPDGIRMSPFGFLVFKAQEYKVYKFKN